MRVFGIVMKNLSDNCLFGEMRFALTAISRRYKEQKAAFPYEMFFFLSTRTTRLLVNNDDDHHS